MALVKRLGKAPKDRTLTNRSQSGQCPDIFSLKGVGLKLKGTEGMRKSTVYAVVGTRVSSDQVAHIAAVAGAPEIASASYETMVAIPEEVLIDAAEALLRQPEQPTFATAVV